MRQEADLTSRAVEAAQQEQVVVGHVGWDSGEHLFDEADPDGPPGTQHTLICVTLGGSNAAKLKGPNTGRKIICCTSDGRIPAVGALVYIVIPHGMEESPGAGCIIAVRAKVRRDNLVNGEVQTTATSGAARTIHRNDGSISLLTTHDNTPDGKVIVFTIAPTSWKFTAPWGSLVFDASGLHIKTAAGPRIDLGGISIPGLPDSLVGAFAGYCNITAPTIKLNGSSVFLGATTPGVPIYHPALLSPIVPTPNAPIPTTPPNPVGIGAAYQTQTVWVAP